MGISSSSQGAIGGGYSSPNVPIQPLKKNCVFYHMKNGLDYPWLVKDYGVLVKAEFSEGGQGWVDYESLHQDVAGGPIHNWWVEHCRAVSHDVAHLAAQHIATFVDPRTRSIVMRFTFANGDVYQSDINGDHFARFFQLEQDYAMALFSQQNM